MEIVRKTIENDEEYLRQISKDVDLKDEEYLKDIKVLEKFCEENECFALAAVQVGIPKRMIYLKNTTLDVDLEEDHNEKKVMINPVVKKRTGHTKYWEACLSCLDNMGLVSRPYKMEVEYYNEKGEKQKEIFEGFPATVLSHELDHLDGVLHMDVAEKVLIIPKEERKEYRESHPYEIISKSGNYEKKVRTK